MTNEELELLKNLQHIIKKNMGNLKHGDRVYLEEHIETVCSYCDSNESGEWHNYLKDAIVIPDAISRDSNQPERGLWGMIDWSQFNANIDGDGEINTGLEHDIPYLVLLKTLKWQTKQKTKKQSNQ